MISVELGPREIQVLTMDDASSFVPKKTNTGFWLTAHTFNDLQDRIRDQRVVLPICSLGTPVAQLQELAPLVLPPLYHEALDVELKSTILHRIEECFPFYHRTRKRVQWKGKISIVELPKEQHPPPQAPIVAFSADTAVEQHGPHLPLATDAIQSHAVLRHLTTEFDDFLIAPSVNYGHSTWGFPFGLSIDLTPPLVTNYVTGFANAIHEWIAPEAVYVVDVNGSIIHRRAVQDGLAQSRIDRLVYRWLHEPLVEFAAECGDQHAGGIETALVEHISEDLVDPHWWPEKYIELVLDQMSYDTAILLSPTLPRLIEYVEARTLNGIVGDIRNYWEVDASQMMDRMLNLARNDVSQLIRAVN